MTHKSCKMSQLLRIESTVILKVAYNQRGIGFDSLMIGGLFI